MDIRFANEHNVHLRNTSSSDFVNFKNNKIIIIICLATIATFLTGLIVYLMKKLLTRRYLKWNRVDDKVIIVTGCSTGIGKETVLGLAKRGAKIYMACKDYAECEEARQYIIDRSNNHKIFNRTLDLSSFRSVRQFAARFLEEETRLDILINNAGIMGQPKTITEDGFESHLAVNHLGHFLLTNLLLDRLKASAPSRIVVVSSKVYIFGSICKNNLNSEKSFSKFKVYCNTKLANILFVRHLSKLLKDTKVTINCCHPGDTRTNMWNDFAPGWFLTITQPLIKLFFKSVKSAAQTSIKLAIDPDLENVTGKYYSNCSPYPLMPKARDEKTAEWLWEISKQWTGLAQEERKSALVNSC